MIDALETCARALVCLGAAILATVALPMALRAVMPDETIPVRTYGPVTWAGDQCRILDDGTLICRKIG